MGGGGHRTGRAPLLDGYDALKLAALRWYPGGKITAQWSTQDSMPADQIPYIGSYPMGRGRLYVAAGFQKWGMTTAMAAAQIITGQICGAPLPYAGVFSPHRLPLPNGLGNVLPDGGVSAARWAAAALL